VQIRKFLDFMHLLGLPICELAQNVGVIKFFTRLNPFNDAVFVNLFGSQLGFGDRLRIPKEVTHGILGANPTVLSRLGQHFPAAGAGHLFFMAYQSSEHKSFLKLRFGVHWQILTQTVVPGFLAF
jgi:hypothetical protein